MSDQDAGNDNDVEHLPKYRTTTYTDRHTIFFACRCSMVNGRLKPGIQRELARQLGFERGAICRQWTTMNDKLAPLLCNQPEDMHLDIIRQNGHILFGDDKCLRKKGKYKYDRDEFMEAV